jgi:hypothetical protein
MNRNRDKGHRFEREVMNLFKDLGYPCTTSRYSSKEKDDSGIDLCGIDPWHIQCKFVDRLGSYHSVLDDMPDIEGRYKLLFHKRSRSGTVVAMPLEDFTEIVQMLIANGVIKTR